MKELSAALKPLARASAPMSIAEGVMREVGTPRTVRRPWVQWGLSAAAALLLAVGTVYMLDRGAAGPSKDAPLAVSKPEANTSFRAKDPAALREDRDELARRGGEVPPPPAAPPAEPAAAEADAEAKKDAPVQDMLGARFDKLAVPVLRVTAADVAAARAEVEAFLKERELKLNPGAPLLGRSAFVRDHYLQLELTDEESKALEKRLAELKETTLARGSLEEEKKRVARELAKTKVLDGADQAQSGLKPSEDDTKERKAAGLEEYAERSRGQKDAPRRKIIFVFEPAPAKK